MRISIPAQLAVDCRPWTVDQNDRILFSPDEVGTDAHDD